MEFRRRLGDLFAGAMHPIDWYIREGLVTRRLHPELPLAILNYTENCMFGKHWDLVTRQCRGLIYDVETEDVIARPFEKFFNYQEVVDSYSFEVRGDAIDKLDGSLGILYPTREGWAVATRGSFESDQAKWATEFYNQRYASVFEPRPGHTYLFEIIYPENRVVLDYGGTADLFLLEVINTDSGTVAWDADWPGPRPEVVAEDVTLTEVLELPDRDNCEGVVFRSHGPLAARVKVKQQDYLERHKARFGLTARTVWEVMVYDHDWDAWMQSVPEEFWGWAEDVRDQIQAAYEARHTAAYAYYDKVVLELGMFFSRKDFAALATQQTLPYGLGPSVLFMIFDGKSIDDYIFERLFPVGTWSAGMTGGEFTTTRIQREGR